MTWEIIQKKVRGIAQKFDPRNFPMREWPEGVIGAAGNVYVRFDHPLYDSRRGKEIHGKLYDSPEEAIEELSAKIVERVLRDGEQVSVMVNVSLPKWTED
ncbi:MAG: hypothetical protein ACREUU_13575 [Gammaproteobacteria bacterium]